VEKAGRGERDGRRGDGVWLEGRENRLNRKGQGVHSGYTQSAPKRVENRETVLRTLWISLSPLLMFLLAFAFFGLPDSSSSREHGFMRILGIFKRKVYRR
jgi:hypothetical protein